MEREVAITGLDAVTPLGTIGPETQDRLCSEERGGSRITRFALEEAGLRTTITCEVDEVPPLPWDSTPKVSPDE